MNNLKFIHAILVAVLCYGQLVANIHAIGHFDVHTHQGIDRSSQLGQHDASHASLSKTAFTADHHAHHAPDVDDTESTSDCAIYHTYLNQFSVLCTARHHSVALLPQTLESNHLRSHLAASSIENQPIRAPPSFS